MTEIAQYRTFNERRSAQSKVRRAAWLDSFIADPYADLAHGEADLAVARQHVERGVEKCVPVEAPPSAGAGGRFARRFR